MLALLSTNTIQTQLSISMLLSDIITFDTWEKMILWVIAGREPISNVRLSDLRVSA